MSVTFKLVEVAAQLGGHIIRVYEPEVDMNTTASAPTHYTLYCWDMHTEMYDIFRTNTLWSFWRQLPLSEDKQVSSCYMIIPNSPFPWQDSV